jgi:hypothetical protein
VHPETVAYIYAVLGEKDRAFAWLEKACDEHTMGMPFLKVDPCPSSKPGALGE